MERPILRFLTLFISQTKYQYMYGSPEVGTPILLHDIKGTIQISSRIYKKGTLIFFFRCMYVGKDIKRNIQKKFKGYETTVNKLIILRDHKNKKLYANSTYLEKMIYFFKFFFLDIKNIYILISHLCTTI